MQTVYTIIADNGDGSQRVEWYKGSEFSHDELVDAASADDAYASGDGVQISRLRFPANFDLDNIEGVLWEKLLPGVYDY